MGVCALCGEKATINKQDNASRTIYNCQSCGVFVLSDLATLQAKKHGNELAAYLTSRKLGASNDIVLISFEKASKDKDYVQLTVDQILEHSPRTFLDTTDLVLQNLARLTSYPGEEVKVEDLSLAAAFYVRKRSYDALSYMIKSMQNMELIYVNYYSQTFFPCGIVVSPKGWERLSDLETGGVSHETALLYLPGKETDYLDIFRKAASKAVHECGLKATELGEIGQTDKINNELLAKVKSSKIVICSLTNASGTSYYVAALAKGLGKPHVLTCHQSALKKLEFDATQTPLVVWKEQKELQLEIYNAIRAVSD